MVIDLVGLLLWAGFSRPVTRSTSQRTEKSLIPTMTVFRPSGEILARLKQKEVIDLTADDDDGGGDGDEEDVLR